MFITSNYIRYLKATMEETTLFILPDVIQLVFDCFDSYKPDWSSDKESLEYKFVNMIKENEIDSSNYKDYQKVIIVLSEEINKYNAYQNDDKVFVFFNELDEYLLKNKKDFNIQTISEFIDSSSELNILYKKTLFYAILKDLYDPYIYNTIGCISDLTTEEIDLKVESIELDQLTSPEFYLLKPKLTYILNDCDKGAGFRYMHDAVDYYDRCANNILKENDDIDKLDEKIFKTLKDIYKAGMSTNKNKDVLSNNRANLQPLLISNPANKNKFTGNIVSNKLVQDILSGRYNKITYAELDDELEKITEEIIMFIEDVLLEDTYIIYSIDDKEAKKSKIELVIYKYMLTVLNGIDKYIFRNTEKYNDIKDVKELYKSEDFSFDISSDFRKTIALYIILKQIIPELFDITNIINNLSTFFSKCAILKDMFDKLIKKLLDSNNFERVMIG